MDTNIVIACAMLVGLIIGGLAGWLSGWAAHRNQPDAAYAEGYSVGYRQAQREEMERAGQELLYRQEAALQRQQAEADARAYKLQREALG